MAVLTAATTGFPSAKMDRKTRNRMTPMATMPASGKMCIRDRAKALGLDLVEVAGNADPPVCRVVDYGRYKYQQSKLQKNNKSRTIKLLSLIHI